MEFQLSLEFLGGTGDWPAPQMVAQVNTEDILIPGHLGLALGPKALLTVSGWLPFPSHRENQSLWVLEYF